MGDFGVRKYDEDIGRFTSIDPLFEKYNGWNPYQYSANNPVNLFDDNGKEYDFTALVQSDKNFADQTVSELSEITGLNLGLTNENKLFIKNESSSNGSETAREIVLNGINNKETISVCSNLWSMGFDNNILLGSDQIQQLKNGTSSDLNPKTLGSGMALIEETLHSDLGGGMKHPGNQKGEDKVLDITNIVRKELGSNWGQRMTQDFISKKGFLWLPFSFKALLSLSQKNGSTPRKEFIKIEEK